MGCEYPGRPSIKEMHDVYCNICGQVFRTRENIIRCTRCEAAQAKLEEE